MKSRTHKAMDTLRKAFKESPNYAHGWHCNLALVIFDEMENIGGSDSDKLAIGNRAASRFMKNAFDVKTSNDMLDIEKP